MSQHRHQHPDLARRPHQLLALGRGGDGEFGDSRAGRWLAGNAWRYGFILRYPPDREELTGIAYEPWHYRYVGRPVARTCHDQGLVLEEYVRRA